MGRTASKESQCLYKGGLYLYLIRGSERARLLADRAYARTYECMYL
jgi:hypothetical protein